MAQCDENRPICRLCAVSDRSCSFSTQDQQTEPKASNRPSREHSSSTDRGHKTIIAERRNAAPLTPSSESICPILSPLLCDANSDASINLDHMELLVHVTQDSDMFNLGTGVESYHPSGLALGLKEALGASYLMHALLAFSAQHLAHLHPEKSAHYLHQAVSLQTRAISLFNATWNEVDKSNCVAVLLFSSVLGHHFLADTLSKRYPEGLDAFIAHYVQCVEMHRGIYTIAKSAWPLLMESELEPILSMSVGLTSRNSIGNDCQPILDLIDSSVGLSGKEKDAYRIAIQYLQVGFDAISGKAELHHNRYEMIYTWTMLVPSEVTSMLVRRQPEALILLAYYAVLLHRGKELWQVLDAGEYIFGIIAQHLSSEWDPWLLYPRQKIVDNDM
jgi:hypothetical protein